MSTVYRANRKASDQDIVSLNSVGLSLATIARALECHPTTITQRLKSLGIPPADTRHAFMEEIFLSMDDLQKAWLVEALRNGMSIKNYMRQLLVDEYKRNLPPPPIEIEPNE